MVIEVVAEFSAFLFFTADDGGDRGRFSTDSHGPSPAARRLRQTAPSEYSARRPGRFAVGYALIGINIFCGLRFRIVGRFIPQQVSQRFEPGFDSDLAACTALRLVGQVEIFQFGFAERGVDGFFQRVGQFALFSDGFEDRLTTVFEFAQIAEASFQIRSCVSSRPPVTSLR